VVGSARYTADPRAGVRLGHDDGAVMLGWFVKIAVMIALVGTVGFDGISIAQAHARAEDTATAAADAAQQAYALHSKVAEAQHAADQVALAAEASVAPHGLVMHPDGSATVTITIVAHTALIGHLPGTDKLVDVTATATVAKGADS
jgi:hypothetical protein